jgi:hypothetical protein
MASPEHVKQYLAYWFQLGKPVRIHNGQDALLPDPIYQGNRYSDAFEQCWQQIVDSKSGDCYLEGTRQTVQDLLSSNWDVVPCARCDMPVPMLVLGSNESSLSCPCNDLPSWPDTELPAPRAAVNSQDELTRIRNRVKHQGRS